MFITPSFILSLLMSNSIKALILYFLCTEIQEIILQFWFIFEFLEIILKDPLHVFFLFHFALFKIIICLSEINF